MEQLRRNDEPLLLAILHQLIVQLGQRHHHPLYVLAVVQPLRGHLDALPLGQLHLDHDHLHVRVRHARVGRLRRADAQHARDVVPRLLLELAARRVLGRLVGVDEARRPLDRVAVERRPVLDDEHGGRGLAGRTARRREEDVAHGDGVDARLGGARLAHGRLPGARLAGLVGVGDALERDPPGLVDGEVFDGGDDGLLGFGCHGEGTVVVLLGEAEGGG